jgi:hypothetical protein
MPYQALRLEVESLVKRYLEHHRDQTGLTMAITFLCSAERILLTHPAIAQVDKKTFDRFIGEFCAETGDWKPNGGKSETISADEFKEKLLTQVRSFSEEYNSTEDLLHAACGLHALANQMQQKLATVSVFN